jgi:hypothetical protein
VLEDQVAAEAAQDGVYVIRTNVTSQTMSADDTVRGSKTLRDFERAFRSVRSSNLKVRPIRHWHENRVRARISLCMLAYYLEWQMREAWRGLHRNPVTPAKRSESALHKSPVGKHPDGTLVHSLRTLLQEMGSILRSTCVPRSARPQASRW